MRCKKHLLSDHSSSVGVCASCLRDSLVSLLNSPNSIPDPIQRFYTTPLYPKPLNSASNSKTRKFSLISNLFRSSSTKPHPDPTNNKGFSPALGFHFHRSPGRVRPSPARSNAPGFAFCLSPLVRASPGRNWAKAGYSGDNRVPAAGNQSKRNLYHAASFWGNSSNL